MASLPTTSICLAIQKQEDRSHNGEMKFKAEAGLFVIAVLAVAAVLFVPLASLDAPLPLLL